MKERSSHKFIWFELEALLALVALAALCVPTPHSTAQQSNRQLNREQPRSNGAEPRRIALVIGNGAYTNAPPLKNPPNDARDMAATLKVLGFEVVSGINVNQRDMKRLIRDFGQTLKAGGSGLFYYAGHGVQSKGHNYLVPVDADIQSEAEVEDSGVDVNLVLNYMDDAQNGLNIVILDACRNNPFSRSFRSASNGLAQVDAPTGTLIAYATAPGRVASDGMGQNGLYTSELLKQMQVPGLSVIEMFMHVRAEVMKQTGSKQVPWEASSLVGMFYFRAPRNNAGTSTTAAANEMKFDPAAFELSYWETIKTSTDPEGFKLYLQKYPNGQFADLAKNKIKSLEASANSAPAKSTTSDSSATEFAYWDSIKNSTDGEDFKSYLEKYPNGQFAALARSNLRRLEAPSMLSDGQSALQKNDLDSAILLLHRATMNDPRLASAWLLLTSAYLRRAALSTDRVKSGADYLGAVRAGEGLMKVRTDAEAVTLFGRALIGSQQYARALAALERATLEPDAKGETFYLLGIAQSRTKNFPKAIVTLQTALQTAALKSPDDINIYRELGYVYEVTRQYAKAFAMYQKGLQLAPNATDFREALERVRPFAK